ncbi:MAG: hypothetical protein PHX68_03295 [Alphaproteobacteria bacterium]|nr:hypothetical protein [Alphaproteobacteria bacterium]
METLSYHQVGLLIRARPFRDRGFALIEEMPEIRLADVDVPGIPISHIRNGDYAAAVRDALDENHRRYDAAADNSLNAFYHEYRRMQDAGFGSLLRAGVRQGVRFVFRDAFPDDSKTTARYTWHDQAVEFQIPKYQAPRPRQNVLAHELGHMMLDGRNAPFAVEKSFVESAAFGRMWFRALEQVAFLYDNRWEDVHAETAFGTEHGRRLTRALDLVKEKYPAGIDNGVWTNEMMCRALEIPAGDARGIGIFPESAVERIGVAAVLLLADARASGNAHADEAVARTWTDFALSDPVRKAHDACLDGQESITRARAFSTDRFARQRQSVSELLRALGRDGADMLAQARQAAAQEHPASERQRKIDCALLNTLRALAEIRTAQQNGQRLYVFREHAGLTLS